MSDFTESILINDPENELLKFVCEYLEIAETQHEEAKTEHEEFYHQGRKDAARSILAMMVNRDFDTIGASSVVRYKLRGDIPLDNGEFIKKD